MAIQLSERTRLWLGLGIAVLAFLAGIWLSALLGGSSLLLAAACWLLLLTGTLHAWERLPPLGAVSNFLGRYAPPPTLYEKEQIRQEKAEWAEELRRFDEELATRQKAEAAALAAKQKAEAEALAAQQKVEAEALAAQKRDEAEELVRTRITREKEIRTFYDEKLNIVRWQTGPIDRVASVQESDGSWINVKMTMDWLAISRSFSSMTTGDVELLKYADIFWNYGFLDDQKHAQIKLGIIYNDGNCEKQSSNYFISRGYENKHSIKNVYDAIQNVMEGWSAARKETATAVLLSAFSRIENEHPDSVAVREFRSKILGGARWLGDTDIGGSVFGDEQPAALFLGESESGKRVWYAGDGSLVSIAPPGAGKTQCHVLTNLLSYRGPAVVLDVKGECYEKTAAWRKANVGPVFKFSPLEPQGSARYNPLAFVSDDPDLLWEESRLLADLLIVPERSNDPSWENRARDVVAGAIAWLARDTKPDSRSMGQIVDVVSKVTWDQFVQGAKMPTGIPAFQPLQRLGNALADMPDRQLEGVLDAARRHLAVWEGARIERVTSACDWTPDMLRDGSNPTIYICIPPNEIESYASLLRVLFAQHLRQLMRKLPPPGQTPILFMLDELPRLGPMKPVEEALEVGRQYGIRLWMIAQSVGQFEKAYANAEGMVGSCAVRIFMNPSGHDGTAKRLSEELGYVESILDGSRQLMVEAADLAGPDYKDCQIVIARNTRPAKLKKVFAYAEAEFRDRMGASA